MSSVSHKHAKSEVTPVRQQTQYNCMTTSLHMALLALGVPESECSVQTVNKVVGAMPLYGAAWEPLLAAANHYGMRSTLTMPSTVRQLKSWTDAGSPVIIGWNPENREWSHASLVFDVTEDEEHGFLVHVADPNIPDPDETVRIVPKKEFYSKWYEKSPQGFMIRRPACVIEREVSGDGKQVMASSPSSPYGRTERLDMKDRIPRTTMASDVAKAYAAKLAASSKLSDRKRADINNALVKAGLDGNGRFNKPEAAYSRALDVLADYGIELDTVVSSHLFKNRPTVVIPIRVAFSNPDDPFSPVSISNSMLYFQSTELRPGAFEAVVYMS